MGQYFVIVNLSKKQYIDINELGENNKFDYLGHGLNGIVLSRLLTLCGGSEEKQMQKWYGNSKKDKIYLGAWALDKTVIVGDYFEEFEVGNFIKTKTNLYDLVEESNKYINVTIDVIKWLSKEDETAQMLVDRSNADNVLKMHLNEIAKLTEFKILKAKLVK